MDKIKIIILALTLSLVSCKKEKPIEREEDKVNCFCGDVELIAVAYDAPGQVRFANYISRNHCTNAPYGFTIDNGLYTEDEFCLNYQW